MFQGVSGHQHRDSSPAPSPAEGMPLWVTFKVFGADFSTFWVPLAELEWILPWPFKLIQKVDGAPLGRLSPKLRAGINLQEPQLKSKH